MSQLPIEQFPALKEIPFIQHGFVERIAGIDVAHEKAEVLKRLDAAHAEARRELGIADWPLLTAQQVHGNQIAVIHRGFSGNKEFAGCDGLITNQKKAVLGIHVADCCAVYIVDPRTPAIGLVHSGKRGTDQAIASKAIEQLRKNFGSNAADLIVQLSPCIRPPHYEIDFAATIVKQCRTAGARKIYVSSECTACDITRYYSYRAEKGKTGRMLAVLALI